MARKTKRRDRQAAADRVPLTDDELARQFAARFSTRAPSFLMPPPAALPAQRPTPTEMITGDDIRNDNTYTTELHTRPGKLWRLRRVEAFDMFMRGVISTPLMGTVEQLDGLMAGLKKSPQEFWKTITEDQKAEVMAVLRNFAKAVVVVPKIVDDDTGDPASLPIELLTFWDLMAILNASPRTHQAPSLTEVEAATFRGAEPRVDGHAASNGQNLRGAAERVPAHTRADVERG